MESFFQKFTRITNKWLWKRVDFDKVYWYQCCDFVKQTASELWYPITTHWNAIDLWKQWLWPNWKRIVKAPGLKPSAWDIVLFNIWTYWHIADADNSSDNASVWVIEQNRTATGTGLWRDAISKGRYWYGVVLGWFTHI